MGLWLLISTEIQPFLHLLEGHFKDFPRLVGLAVAMEAAARLHCVDVMMSAQLKLNFLCTRVEIRDPLSIIKNHATFLWVLCVYIYII